MRFWRKPKTCHRNFLVELADKRNESIDVYEAYSRILRGESIELLNLNDRQQEIIAKFRRYEAREMCHAAISAKTGLCASTIQDMKRTYNNLKNGETLVISQCIRKSMPINEKGSQTIIEGIA